MERNPVYDKYLTSGFLDAHICKENIKGNLASYKYNFGTVLPNDRDSRILDIGFGMGEFLSYLKRSGYTNFEGVEIGPEQVEYCRKHVTDRVQLIDDLSNYLNAHTACFEAIVMIDILDHLPKDEIIKTLSLIKDCLVNQGVFLAKVENMARLTAIFKRYDDFTHEIGFTQHSLYQVLSTAGFDDIQICAFCFPHIRIRSRIRGIIKRVMQTFWGLILRVDLGEKLIVAPTLLVVARTSTDTQSR